MVLNQVLLIIYKALENKTMNCFNRIESFLKSPFHKACFRKKLDDFAAVFLNVFMLVKKLKYYFVESLILSVSKTVFGLRIRWVHAKIWAVKEKEGRHHRAQIQVVSRFISFAPQDYQLMEWNEINFVL
jgi:hypothetical protein